MSQFTKKAITEAFIALLNKKTLDKITVVDIAEKCGINRNTFYYYYSDIYALVEEVFDNEKQRIMEEHKSFSSWPEGFMEATSFARANKKALYHIYNSVSRDTLETFLYDVVMVNMTDFVTGQAQGLSVSKEDIHCLASFYTSALMGLVIKWMHDGMKQDPDSYISNISRLLDGNIRASLERNCSHSTKT